MSLLFAYGIIHCCMMFASKLLISGNRFDQCYTWFRVIPYGDSWLCRSFGAFILDYRNCSCYTTGLHFQGYVLAIFANNHGLFVGVVIDTLVVRSPLKYLSSITKHAGIRQEPPVFCTQFRSCTIMFKVAYIP